jgi:hypothetical protein
MLLVELELQSINGNLIHQGLRANVGTNQNTYTTPILTTPNVCTEPYTQATGCIQVQMLL